MSSELTPSTRVHTYSYNVQYDTHLTATMRLILVRQNLFMATWIIDCVRSHSSDRARPSWRRSETAEPRRPPFSKMVSECMTAVVFYPDSKPRAHSL